MCCSVAKCAHLTGFVVVSNEISRLVFVRYSKLKTRQKT